MRKKITDNTKRDLMIGVKIDPATKAKIEYIAKAQSEPTSTYIFNLITAHINGYAKQYRIDWEKELEEGGIENGIN